MIKVKKLLNLKENKTVDYIKRVSSMYKNNYSGDSYEFWEWKSKVVKPVKCVSYKDIPGLEEKVEKFLKRDRLKIKECYYNSLKVVWEIEDTYYVDGMADLIIPIDHAWNYYKGYYFDLTAELVLNLKVEDYDYAQILNLNRREVNRMASKTGHSGSYIGDYFIDNIKKD